MSVHYIWLGIHIFGVIIAFALLFSVISKQNLEYKAWLILTVVCCLMALTAKSLFIVADDFREMVVLAKLEYMGKCFANYYALLFILQYRRIKWPKWVTKGMLGINFVMFCIIMTCDYHKLYYKSMGVSVSKVGNLLVLEKAPLYYFYMAFILFEAFLYLYLSLDMLIRFRKNKEYRKLHLTLVAAGMAPFILLFLHVIGGPIFEQDMTPIGILIAAMLFVGAVNYYGLFDLVRNAKDNVVENIEEGIFVTDQYMNFLYANPAATRLWDDMKKHKNRVETEMLREIYNQSGSVLEWNRKKYEIRSLELGENSQQKGYLISVIDVTAVMQQAEAMKELKEKAEEANRAKSLFLAKMSHEIRTPINAVLNMNEMILRESTEEEIKKYGLDVKSAAKNLLSIINDILDLSKIESGNMEIIPVEYELSSLLNDVVHMIYARAKEKDLEFKISVSPKLPAALFGDDVRIRQILVNLLTNAVKYTPDGTVSLTVDGGIQGDDAILHFAVRDTGIGIKEEDLPKLCEMFQRIEESRNRNIEGTGLGMTITVQLLNMMGSRLQVDSTYGEGSTFSFELVQKIVRQDAIGDFQERINELGQEYSYRTSFVAPEAKLLVVDDCDMNRKVFRSLLKQTQVQITDVSSGMACLEKVRENHYDMIFLDHMMPEMDGMDTLRQLKIMEDNLCKNTPIIMLTANAITGAKEEYLKKGFDDFLSKPVIPEKLERMIQKYLPKEFLKEVTEEESRVETEDSELPDISGINWEYAKTHIPDYAILKQTAKDFYVSTDMEMEVLQKFYNLIDQEEYLEQYRIRIHALKSSAAMIGATILSSLANLLEKACNENNLKKIGTLHPIMLEELQKCKESMSVLKEDTLGKEEIIDATQILSLLDRLQNSLEEYDYDSADELMEEFEKFSYGESIQKNVDALHMHVMNFDIENAKAEIEKLINHILGGK